MLDLATGCKGISKLLPPGIRYLGADEFTPACKLNDGRLPKLSDSVVNDAQGAVLALGVLEQVCDLPSFLEALKSYYLPLVLSYSPVDRKDGDVSGRSNSLTTGQWRLMLEKLQLGRTRHEARVHIDGAAHLVYWFEPY